jgi:hypothetical protein
MFQNVELQDSSYPFWKSGAIARVSQDGLSLRRLSRECRKDIDIVRAAVKQNPFALFYAPEFQNNREIALLAVEGNGHSIAAISRDLQKDAEIGEVAKKNLPQRRERSLQKSADHRIFAARTCIKAIFSQVQDIYNELTYVTYAKRRPSSFLRDSRVILFDGTHLIPNPFSEESTFLLSILFPLSAGHFLEEAIIEEGLHLDCTGKGLNQKNREYAIASAYLYDLPFKQGRSCVEGGNCLLFSNHGKRYAIIGELSLLTSYLALAEKDLLVEITPEKRGEPSDHAYRIARNYALFLKKAEKLKEHSSTQFFYSFLNPISPEEKIEHEEKAQIYDAKLKRTKEYIAEDLELPVENLIIIPQLRFHIDMEMFVTPDGEIVLHDDQLAFEFLKQIEVEGEKKALNEGEQKLVQEFRANDKANVEKFKEYQLARIQILQSYGCKVHLLPAVFEAPASKIALNYCNGIFARRGKRGFYTKNKETFFGLQKEKEYVFITTGTSSPAEEVFHQKFISYYRATFPHLDIQPLKGVSQFIDKHQGGIHCLTFEASLIS